MPNEAHSKVYVCMKEKRLGYNKEFMNWIETSSRPCVVFRFVSSVVGGAAASQCSVAV